MTAAFNILINKRAGTVLAMGEPAIEAAIQTAGIDVGEQIFAEPGDIHAELERLAALDAPLLIGGGDGTIRDCAEVLAKHKKAFGVLPFGTMNMLATDLGITSLPQALKAYASGTREVRMDAGFVNGNIFLCCASIGTMPHASVFREKNRLANKAILIPKLFLFVLRHFKMHSRDRAVLEIDGQMTKVRSPAIVISANRFADSQKLTESNFKRASLDGNELAAYVFVAKTNATHIRFMWRLIFGHWLKDPDLTETTGQKMRIWSKHHRTLVSIDGEVTKLASPLEFSLKAGWVPVLVPAPAAQGAA
jgi:diacylglycerol kinase family enzyme